jgi:hypothetical protein
MELEWAKKRKQEISEEKVILDEEIEKLEYEIAEMKSLLEDISGDDIAEGDIEEEEEDYGFGGDWWQN